MFLLPPFQPRQVGRHHHRRRHLRRRRVRRLLLLLPLLLAGQEKDPGPGIRFIITLHFLRSLRMVPTC
jgi:hypothetical protein